MPIIKSAKKRVLQAAKRQKRNYSVRNDLKKVIKAVIEAAKSGSKAEAEKLLPGAYKIIDTAAKKRVLNKKTAGRRKSLLARAIANIGKTKAVEVKAAPKAKAEKAKKPAAAKAPKKAVKK